MEGILLSEAARRIGISQAHVQRLVQSGRIRVRKRIGAILLLDADDVAKIASDKERMRQWLAGVEHM